MTNSLVRAVMPGLVFLVAVGCAVTQTDHPHRMGNHADPSDARVALDLGPAVQEALKLTMREHLEALQAIVAALAREDYDKAAAVAHEDLGFPKHHQAMQREQGAPFPPKYQELAMAHHQTAEDLASVIPSKDLKRILSHLDKTMTACTNCHRTFKLGP